MLSTYKPDFFINTFDGRGFHIDSGAMWQEAKSVIGSRDYEAEPMGLKMEHEALWRLCSNLTEFFNFQPELDEMSTNEKKAFSFFVSYGYEGLNELMQKVERLTYITDIDAYIDDCVSNMGIKDSHPLYSYIDQEAILRDKVLNRELYDLGDGVYCVSPYFQ